jgi:hypothetical protein
MTMREAAAAKSDDVDDALIIAVTRAAQASGLTVLFDDAVMDGDAIKVGASLSTVVDVNGSETIAHGRRLALLALLEMVGRRFESTPIFGG